jgi:hypothetical protein
LELNVGGDSSGGDLRPVLVGGELGVEDESCSSHPGGGWEGGRLNVRHQFGEDVVPHGGVRDGVISVGRLEQTFVGEDSLGPDEGGVLGVVDDVFQILDDFWVSQDSNGGEEDSLLLVPSSVHNSGPQFLHDESENFLSGKVGSAERTRNLNGEFGFGDARVDTSLVGEGSKGQKSNLSVSLGSSNDSFNGLPEHTDELFGWESGVLWHGQEVVNLLDGVNLAGSDQMVADSESRGSSGDEEGIVEEGVKSSGVGGLAFNHQRCVHTL